MGTHDILYALDWLSWRLFAHNRKYSQEYLDKMAEKALREAVSSPHTAPEVLEKAQKYLDQAKQSPCPGFLDKSCNALCKNILRNASEEDFTRMLAVHPRKIVQWRKLWDDFRAGRIRRI